MLVDWFTVIAQVLNFLILVWLLKRFLYRPILNAIDAREKRIADELANADAKKAEAQKEQAEFKRKNEEFDRQRSALLSRAREEAKAERQRLMDEARKAAADLSSKLQETLRNDKQNLNQEISHRARQEVFAIARKALGDLAGASLEERMVDVFVRKLHTLKDTEREQLVSEFNSPDSPILIRTTFDLPPEQRALIEGAVQETLGKEAQTRFVIDPDLISGIELTVNGQKVAWSLEAYLESLEKGVDELLKEQSKPENGAEPEPEPDETEPNPGPASEKEIKSEPKPQKSQ
ncbi:F0F1 ATP synthase subunit B [Methanosarcina sp. Z-7115]|uniref:F0F1 ATP synthase subunit B n=1 Tax=Methanosarcina baikalica TaxID=3073890 RepID=A0ABU2D3U1_9EURY|nr:F0F1 ATP synthase subunit B [Methanosarcina sp. Z-7115]MDR7666633.1 F0F1 ATP synthase subunit B [Methanosarcina sp. Z-7115]